MNESAGAQLTELVGRFGPSLATDIRRAEALLLDYCGEHVSEVNTLVVAVRSGVTEQIAHARDESLDEQFFDALTQRLAASHELTIEDARWAVTTWANALGKKASTPVVRDVSTADDAPGMLLVVVDANGNGDAETIEDALERVAAGGRIRIRAGTYDLAQPLIIRKSLTIEGQGVERTFIKSSNGPGVMAFVGECQWSIHGVAFSYTGKNTANVVEVHGGELQLSKCSFSGAILNLEVSPSGGTGLIVVKGAIGAITECEFYANQLHGIHVQSSNLTINNNKCRGNGMNGISLFGVDKGVCKHNSCSENVVGIAIVTQCKVSLEANDCSDNMLYGIAYGADAGGGAHRNKCSRNALAGIHVTEQAEPRLAWNRCEENGKGILYGGTASGVASANDCLKNETGGIVVTEKARPTLDGNRVRENRAFGIAYAGEAEGSATDNKCCANKGPGIFVVSEATPTLSDNHCSDNIGWGIQYGENAGGAARANVCEHNEEGGIQLTGSAKPLLEANNCKKNKAAGIHYSDRASGLAQGNNCHGNEMGILVMDEANPDLAKNSCVGNEKYGIFWFGEGGGEGGVNRENICISNAAGIHISEPRNPQMINNNCEHNKDSDVFDWRE